MEEYKYLPPKFSYALKELARFFEVFEQTGPLSSMSKNSSEHSFQSNRKHEGSTHRSSNSLRTIKEALGKNKQPMGRFKAVKVTTARRRRRSSKGLISLGGRSLSNSRSRSRSKSKSKSKYPRHKTTTKQPRYRRIRSKVLYAAEKRGLRIQNSNLGNLNQTLMNFKPPIPYEQTPQARFGSNILVADRLAGQSSSQMPDILSKYSLAQSQNTPIEESYIPRSKYANKGQSNEYDINQKRNLSININYSEETKGKINPYDYSKRYRHSPD